MTQKCTALAGGAVGEVWKVEDGERVCVVKRQPGGAPPGFFAAEAEGLQYLREADALRVPEVLAVTDDALTLEWLAPTPPSRDFTQRFAEGLAQQHRVTSSAFGLERDNFLGPYGQANRWCDTWADFYAEYRLRPQLILATRDGKLPQDRRMGFDSLLAMLPELLSGIADEPPALVHGDLWRGNLLSTNDGPALIDPAVYFGSREVELAYIELFGGFPEGVFATYHAAFPLRTGYERRRPIHQLYPLLVHVNYFGEQYGPQLDATLLEALASL